MLLRQKKLINLIKVLSTPSKKLDRKNKLDSSSQNFFWLSKKIYMYIYIFFFFWIPRQQNFNALKKNVDPPTQKKKIGQKKIVSVLLSASVERFSVSHMQDLKKYNLEERFFKTHLI